MKKIAVKGALVVAFCVISAFGQASGWKDYEYTEDGFAISCPSKPSLEKDFVDTEAGKLEMHNYTISAGSFWSINISVIDVSRFGDMRAKELLQAGKDGAAKETKGTVLSEKEISLNGTPGIEYEIATANGRTRSRTYYVGGRTISVMSTASSKLDFFPETERFFNSLRFIPAWKDYEYAGDRFRVSVPSPPSYKSKPVNTAAGQAEMHMYSIGLGNDAGVMIAVSIYPEGTKIPIDTFSKIKDATLQSVNGKLLSEKNISLDDNPGTEFELMGTGGYHARIRYYIVGSRLISLASYNSQERPLPADTTRIFDSLKLLKGP